MGLQGNQSTSPKLHSLKVTQSLYGIVRPLVWGCNRVQLNLLWYGDFVALKQQTGGKGLGKDGSGYDYHAAVLGTLCEGPVLGIGNIWSQNGRLTLQSATEAYTIPPGGGTYSVANTGAYHSDAGVAILSNYDGHADDYGSGGSSHYSGVARAALLLADEPVDSGTYSSGGDGTYSFSPSDAGATVEITYSYSLYVLAETEDYNVPLTPPYEITVQYQPQFRADLGVVDPLTGYVFGIGGGVGQYNVSSGNYFFSAADAGRAVAISYNWRQTDSNLDPAAALQFTLIEGTQGQEPWSYLTSRHLSQALGYTGLALIGAPNMDLGPSATLPNYNYEVYGRFQFGAGVRDADAALVIRDLLTNPLYGAGYRGAISASLMTVAREYWNSNSFWISPVLDTARPCAEIIEEWCAAGNVGTYYSEGTLKFVPYGDTTTVGNGYLYSPQTSPLVDLNDDDFMPEGSEDPVTLERTLWQDAFNEIKVQYTSRINNYNSSTVVEQDDAAIAAFGIRAEGQKDYSFLCTETAATFAANLRLKRAVNIRKKYTFRISGLRYIFLEPMDLVTITDAKLRLSKEPVRIIEIEEDESRIFTITAEEFPWGTAKATIYIKQPGMPPPPPPALASPGNTVVDSIFEPSARVAVTLANSPYQLWLAIHGGRNWGGCEILWSLDNQTYESIGIQNGPSRAGIITADLPAGVGLDLVDTLSVRIEGEIVTVSQEQADSLSTLSKVGTEYLAYENVNLTASDGSENSYDLTALRRGAFSSPSSSHTATDPQQNSFVRLDDQVFKKSYDPSLAGKTVWFKFLSFNLLGNQKQSPGDVEAVPYTIGGHNVATDMTVDSVLAPDETTAIIRIYQAAGGPGTSGSASLENGAIVPLPAFDYNSLPLSTQFYVNFNPTSGMYALYTDKNQYLQDELLGGCIRIGPVLTASNFFLVPLSGGGSMGFGAGYGSTGSFITVPPGFDITNSLKFAAVRTGNGGQSIGVASSSATGGMLGSYMAQRGGGAPTAGDTNWLAAIFSGSQAATTTVIGSTTFVEVTTAMGDTICVANVGDLPHAWNVPIPDGYTADQVVSISGPSGTFPTGNGLQGVANCSLDSSLRLTMLYTDGPGGDNNFWPGLANVFAVFWKSGGGIYPVGIPGGSGIVIPLPNNRLMLLGQTHLASGGFIALPAPFAGSSMVAACAMAGFVPSGDNVSHGWTQAYNIGPSVYFTYLDGSGHTWPGFGNIFVVAAT